MNDTVSEKKLTADKKLPPFSEELAHYLIAAAWACAVLGFIAVLITYSYLPEKKYAFSDAEKTLQSTLYWLIAGQIITGLLSALMFYALGCLCRGVREIWLNQQTENEKGG